MRRSGYERGSRYERERLLERRAKEISYDGAGHVEERAPPMRRLSMTASPKLSMRKQSVEAPSL